MHFTNSEMATASRTRFHHFIIFEIDEISQQATTSDIHENLIFEHDEHLIEFNE